jgi:hypothetical protein
MSLTENRDVVLRTKSQALIILIAGVAGCVALVITGLDPARNASSHRAAPGSSAVAYVAAAAVLVVAIRLARCAAVIRSEDLLVRNPFRTTSVPWSAITGFRVGRHGLWPRVCIAARRDGSEIAIWGIQDRGPLRRRPGGGSAAALLKQLNEALPAGQH